MISAFAAGLPLADNNFGDTQTDGIAGPVGLLIIVLLVIATVFLIRNMNKRIRRLPDRFSPGSEQSAASDEKSRADGSLAAGSWRNEKSRDDSSND